MLTDGYGRALTYLRLSVTDACNLRCLYCMPGGRGRCRVSGMETDEIARLAGIALSLGIKKVRITGGEPLLRKDIVEIVWAMSALGGPRRIEDLSLTTNGIFLPRYAHALKKAGLKRINVSLDTLDGRKFPRIAGHGMIEDVLAGIDEAQKAGFSPVKINAVILRGVNDDELLSFVDFGRDHGCIVRFIEFMPMVQGSKWKAYYIPREEILKKLDGVMDRSVVPWGSDHEPAKYYRTVHGTTIGIISPVTHGFCEGCNRLRITADGHLRACIGSSGEVDLLGPLRSGASDEEIATLFHQAAMMKPRRAVFDEPRECRPMYQIGG